ncbi:MAG: GNAT family N-acetyltransferase, partial [Spirochaetota bacterium]
MPLIRKARITDVGAIHDLLLPYSEKGIVLRRSHADIEINIPSFYVAEEEGEVRGVIAFHSYGSHLKEIRSLAVRIDSKKKGIGRKLVE